MYGYVRFVIPQDVFMSIQQPTTPPPSIAILPISLLKVGMFISNIHHQIGDKELISQGLLKNHEQIKKLEAQGILSVEVDLQKSKISTDNIILDQASCIKRDVEKIRNHPSDKARKLYNEAKVLQEKLLNQLSQGEPIDIKPLSDVADEMVEAIFTHRDVIMCLSKIREKDSYLMEHSLNVALMLANFGRFLGLDRSILQQLTMGGLLHDIGKTLIPDEILHKPGKLTEHEFEIMKDHVIFSKKILSKTAGITPIMMEVAANHHERIDGSGYPCGLIGDEFGLYGRMSSIIDVYDALSADRVYKSGMSPTQAFRILLQGAGKHFDADLVSKFIKCLGVYPIGSLVILSNKRLGIVIKRNDNEPLKPTVKLIYHVTAKHYIDIKIVDLSKAGCQEYIEGVVDPRDYGIQVANFIATV